MHGKVQTSAFVRTYTTSTAACMTLCRVYAEQSKRSKMSHKHCIFCGEEIPVPRPTSWSSVCESPSNTMTPDTVGKRYHAFMISRDYKNFQAGTATPVETNWNAITAELNRLHSLLQDKPKSEKCGHWHEAGSILNAYREGDVTFAQ